ncbi:unnamed protein product [Triticum turgidum subsp. durum]|uniref:Uncharacterized protein n=1 Tax=Triticum turgidum subsp. durum TaxID=4567 RepID=A0A9R0R362_TRITD|nr:unnamed protein product [Triticum turgidum subsp. durum]
MPSRVGADDTGGGPGVGEIVEASSGARESAVPPGNRSATRKTARFVEPMPAPRGGGPSRLDRSMSSVPALALEGLKFISETDASKGWTRAAGFFDSNAQNDLLPRSMFGECIGMKEVAFAGELFDTLARRRGISGDSIDKAELREFWDQISDPSFKSRLQLFFDMVDKNADGKISEAEVKQIITLSASANHLTITAQQSEEYVKLIMEELDPHGRGYIEYRHRAVFKVMGYCVCVAKGGAETLKFNMALTLLPVCRNAVTWLRSRTTLGRFVPFNDNLNFHKVIAVGISVGAGLHIISHLTCDFPRLVHATDDEYEPMKPFFGDVKPPNYWWFLKGTEGWTGLVMLVLMAITFTLATGRFRKRELRRPKPKKSNSLVESKNPNSLPGLLGRLTRSVSASHNRLTMIINALFNRFTGYNAFLYTHHLFVIVYALLIVHGHFLYLTKKWQKKTTWMYLTVPVVVYACERLTRTLRSRVRLVEKIKVAVHPHPASLLSLHMSKPEGFRFKGGQYIFIKCPGVSKFEWHPFSITSAPEDDCVNVHIKALGDWTEDLRDAFLKVCPNTEGKNEIRQVEYDRDDAKSDPRFPKILIDGPYGAPAEDYKQYEVVLLVGLGIGATPMISIIKDIINNTKRLGDIESVNPVPGDASPSASFKTRRAYFYWTTREQGSFEWFRGIMDEVAETDEDGIIKLHTHCTSVHKEGDARSAPLTILQSLYYAKHGIDIISGSRVKTTFGRANWREAYERIAQENQEKRVGQYHTETNYYSCFAIRNYCTYDYGFVRLTSNGCRQVGPCSRIRRWPTDRSSRTVPLVT